MGSSPKSDYGKTKPPSSPKRKRSLKFERRFLLLSFIASAPGLLVSFLFLALHDWTVQTKVSLAFLLLLAWLVSFAVLHDAVIRPLQTMANVVAALREEDYSFRARGVVSQDAMGELALEVNTLADILATQKTRTVEATALLRRVVEEVDVPLFAFDPQGILRLVNSAGARLVKSRSEVLVGRSAAEIGLGACLQAANEETISFDGQNAGARWLLRRSQFRQSGVPHTLMVLSDVSRALREEERSAWQRLIRVLGHELNNSLTPIKSIAGTLASRMFSVPDDWKEKEDFTRGLAIIEARAASLNRFLQSYRQLAQMPHPKLRRCRLAPLVERVAALELRLPVQVIPGPDIDLLMDPDQVEQMFINLLRNAADAALAANPPGAAEVQIGWTCADNDVQLIVLDNGAGLLNPDNVFVPFYTTKEGGSGIGLVLSRQVAEAHRGSLHLLQRHDKPGCMARVVLPRTL